MGCCNCCRRNIKPVQRPLITPDADIRSLEDRILDSKHLDSRGDYDFTNMVDDGNKHMRGGYPYNRPYGWKKVGLRVKGKYKNDNWLENNGGMNGGWAITYHGTRKECFNPICEQGYKIGPRAGFGKGVYSSPDIDVALTYSTVFRYNGVAYKGVFQNRVNPNGVNIVHGGNFWVCSNPEDIRPYALCIRKCN